MAGDGRKRIFFTEKAILLQYRGGVYSCGASRHAIASPSENFGYFPNRRVGWASNILHSSTDITRGNHRRNKGRRAIISLYGANVTDASWIA